MRFALLILSALFFVCAGFSQTVQSIRFTINVSSAPLTINAGEIDLDGLQAGTTYSTVPDGGGGLLITPNDGYASVLSATETSISGDINSRILLSFILPTHLYSTSGTTGGFVVTRFSLNSAAWGPSGAETNYFDPNVPTVVSLDGSGNAFVSLGGIFEIPPNTGTDTYLGDALVIAQYTGL